MPTYNADDGAIVGNFVSLDTLDESQRGEKKADPGDHAEAQGPRALVVSQHGEGSGGVARTTVKQRRGQQEVDGKLLSKRGAGAGARGGCSSRGGLLHKH